MICPRFWRSILRLNGFLSQMRWEICEAKSTRLEEMEDIRSLKESVWTNSKIQTFYWLLFSVILTGLQFSTDTYKKFSGTLKWAFREPFGMLDLNVLGDRVKNMDIVSSSQGNFFFFKSLQEGDVSISTQLLEQVWENNYIFSRRLFLFSLGYSFRLSISTNKRWDPCLPIRKLWETVP